MKKTSDINSKLLAGRKTRRPSLVAYTLNNTQPVICTIIADQPYFYMDEQDQFESDDILGFEEYDNFERDIVELKRKMDAFERMSKSTARDPARRIEEFLAEAITITEAAPAVATSIDHVVARLSQSRMAKTLMDFAQEHGVTFAQGLQTDGAYYDREAGQVFLNITIAETELVLLAARELRRHWQHRKGALIHPLSFHPDQAVLINRAQQADMTIAMIRTAWEVQLAGERDLWDFIENSSMADLGRTFAREAFVDFRALASGKAASAVFESWFLSERCRHQDKKLIQAMLADHQGYVFTDTEASRSVSIELICALGEEPFGKNYLAPYAHMIVEDPIFTEVRDRSNANFLWFIKFERSFRETEQALQNEDMSSEDDSFASFTPRKKADNETRNEHEPESIIIHLPRSAGFIHRHGGDTLEESGSGTNVIHVRFGEGAF